jgi:osmotically-inducible protein OsmY
MASITNPITHVAVAVARVVQGVKSVRNDMRVE